MATSEFTRPRGNFTGDADAPTGEDENSVLLQTGQGIFKGLLLEEEGAGDKYAGDNRALPSPDALPAAPTFEDNAKKTPLPVNQVAAFRGIRYASAPTKRLRFMPPTAYHYGPSQVHEARKFGPICPQQWPVSVPRPRPAATSGQQQQQQQDEQLVNLMARVMPSESYAYLRPLMSQLIGSEQSEDCLNLNIYTTLKAISSKVIGGGRKYRELAADLENKSAPLPVLVIIHGESFDYGSGNTINGAKFAQRNKLVVVTFNYRLNILGFPPRLAGASRGNLGLMDQVAALHWIKDNIESFGGSANNITLMGSKRAAIFVNLLMMSPLAKDLFQRAIMEDGSALTPLVANHIQQQFAHPASGSPINNLQVASSWSSSAQAAQHVRLLAKLCDCPVRFEPPAPQTQTTPANGYAASGKSSPQAANSSALQLTSGADETRANALMFECLRDKPVDQIVQFQPNGLIHFNQLTGELSVPGKVWAKYLELLARDGGQSGDWPGPVANSELVTLEPKEVNGFLSRLASMVALANNNESAANNLLLELFDAVHLNKHKPFAASASLYPLFAPIIDGTIVPDEDLALAMLRSSSNFAQRNLLIGLSRPLLVQAQGNQTDLLETGYSVRLPPEHPLADWITPAMERAGLSNEQAVELINLFVRSFYRFHNQEITNSIISQYLNSVVIGRAKQRRKQHPEVSEDSEDYKAREQQLLVLDALLQAFKDALVNVPVLKTALIHATKQLEPLIEPFVGQQFERWRRDHNHKLETPATNNHNQLLESFITFAQTLYSDKNWPLELQASRGQSAAGLNNPKATYLYQFNGHLVLKQIQSLLAKLDHQVATSGPTKNIWLAMRGRVSELLAKLNAGPYLARLGMGCALDPTIAQQDDSLLRHLLVWLCDKFSSTLADFALTGNVNKRAVSNSDEIDYGANIFDEIQQFSTSSACGRQIASRELSLDHHSVNPSSFREEASTRLAEVDCFEQMNLLAFKFLARELSGSGDSHDFQVIEDSWRVFDVFSQQLATIPGNLKQEQRWKSSELIENNNFDQDSILARSSFWSNFIPALNCSRTQPINPLSLLGGNHFSTSAGSASSTRSLLNSTLMNINLVFTCQSGVGIKTVHEIIDSMVVKMGNDLQAKIDHWLLVNNRPQSMQNHHSLRMANLNQSNSMIAELENLESAGKQDSYTNNTLLDTVELSNNSNLFTTNEHQVNRMNLASKISFIAADERVKYGALLACCLLISITIGANLLKRRKRLSKSNSSQSDSKVEDEEDSSGIRVAGKQTGEQPSNNQIEFKQLFVNDNEPQNYPAHQNTMANGGIMQLSNGHLMETANSNRETLTSGHVYAIDTGDQLEPNQQTVATYWTNNPEETITLCRSHSTMSMSNGSTIVENLQKLADQTGNNPMSSVNQEELIMSMVLPQEAPMRLHRNQQEAHFGSCIMLSNGSSLSGNGHYGGSSGDTQNQSSLSSPQTTTFNNSAAATMKKRVKIRDPPTRGPGSLERTGNRQARAGKQVYSNGNNQQQQQPQQLFCPVHHPLNRQEADLSPEANILATNLHPNDYYLGELSFDYSPNLDPSLQWANETSQLIEGAYGQQLVIPAQSGQQQQQSTMSNNNPQLTNHHQQMIHYHRHPQQQQ